MAWATGRRSHAISDRSGMAFPYQEMVREWTGALVHISEFESKHPQIRRRTVRADAVALKNSRTQDFTFKSGGAIFTTANLTLPGLFAFNSNGMQPDDGSSQNRKRELGASIGSVTISIT
jgi:predicted outer membrane repeat protein|tara:strand:- start:660 stop:1019 length:360 start_codon:yes stop_codon:yes gene_type:complete